MSMLVVRAWQPEARLVEGSGPKVLGAEPSAVETATP
jgi:hypothetical protein